MLVTTARNRPTSEHKHGHSSRAPGPRVRRGLVAYGWSASGRPSVLLSTQFPEQRAPSATCALTKCTHQKLPHGTRACGHGAQLRATMRAGGTAGL